MRVFISILALSLSALTDMAFAGCKPPVDVSARVGTASIFLFNWTAAEYANGVASRDYHWNNQPTSAQGYAVRLPAESFSSAYAAVSRVASYGRSFGPVDVIRACASNPAPGGCTLDWFQRNHPDWVVYRGDQSTPAYQFSDPSWIPLDIANPEVQSWIMQQQFLPILRAGYQGISFDNVGATNDWNESGICSVAIPSGTCASNGGAWTKLYSGAVRGDATFLRGRVEWLKAATRFINDHDGCSSANIIFDPRDRGAMAQLIDAVDIWYDEAGFTGDSNPSACSVAGAGSGSVGAAWIAKAKFIIERGPAKPMVQQNSICPGNVPRTRVKEILDYALASYLLTKNARTYIAWTFDDGKAGTTSHYNDPAAWPQLAWRHGQALEAMTEVAGVYRRRFENGLALLNPSTERGVEYELTAAFEDFDGAIYQGRITLKPGSALVLRNATPKR